MSVHPAYRYYTRYEENHIQNVKEGQMFCQRPSSKFFYYSLVPTLLTVLFKKLTRGEGF